MKCEVCFRVLKEEPGHSQHLISFELEPGQPIHFICSTCYQSFHQFLLNYLTDRNVFQSKYREQYYNFLKGDIKC